MNPPEISIWHIMGISSFALAITLGTLYLGWLLEKDRNGPSMSFKSVTRFAFSKTGLLGIALLPLICFALFHGFVIDVWLTLQRWPNFGEQLHQPWLELHFQATFFGFVGMIFSQIGVGVVFLCSLVIPRMRWMCVSSITHFVFSFAVFLSIHLAPHPFLNWLFD